MGSCQSGSSQTVQVQDPSWTNSDIQTDKGQEDDEMYRKYKEKQDQEKAKEKNEEIQPATTKEGVKLVTTTGDVKSAAATGVEGTAMPPAPPTPRGPPLPQAKPLTDEEKKKKEDVKAKQLKDLDDLMKMAKDIEDKIKQKMVDKGMKIPTEQQLSTLDKAYHGDIDLVCPPLTKIVRIFTSSTFTDTKNERNMLMKHAYPKVKEHCRKIGYEFQVVDMRWGIRDEAADDHMTTELCMKELKLCQEVSTGPNFISLLSHKYGYIPFPRVIEATELEKLMAVMDDTDTKQLFDKWFTCDKNAVPPAYVLSPVSKRIPDFISNDKEKKKIAKQAWWDESEQMQIALEVAASKIFDKETARKYIMSVSEIEVQAGLLDSKDASKHGLWLKRNIEDIEEQPSSYILSRYIECTGDEEKWKKSRQLLNELKNERMAKKLSPDRILNYSVQWNEKDGISPDNETKHKEYLETMCGDFVNSLTKMIDTSVEEKEQSAENQVLDELQHQIRFCQDKCKGFQGRQDTLKLIQDYIQGTSNVPLVLHGTSGTGKTSIMAMAAKMMKQWVPKTHGVIVRFLGTSPFSSNLYAVMETITQQISHIYKLNAQKFSGAQTLHIKVLQFKLALTKGRPEKPLIIILDSLDQLDPTHDARKLAWLPAKLTAGTKVIVSTLPEPEYDCFPALQARIKTPSNFVDIPPLTKDDAQSILDGWLTDRKRSLSEEQMKIVLTAFYKCPTPLFLKLSFEEASTWTSFLPIDQTVLQDTIRASIDFLFQKLEKVHGQMLISRALGYLTLANNGATEAELEDILSCDDDVLNDVYTYWTPPMRRLPPLLLVRIRTDLSQYLVERLADNVRVIYWYHRQFIEAAEARYCSDKPTNKLIHERLADFFNGTWSKGCKKPYTNAKGESGEEDRHVSLQPLKFGPKSYNLRTLNNLPYHRMKAGQIQLLKDQCLTNPKFLIHKLHAVPLHDVLDDFYSAKQAFPEDKAIKEILQALLLSQKGLAKDPRQIVPQLLLRLNESEDTKGVLQECRNYPETYLLPTQSILEKPGGQLVHSIAAHKSDIDMIDLSQNGKIAVTVCQSNKEVTLWNLEEGKEKRSVKGLGQCTAVRFCNNDTWIACEADKKILVQDVDTGRQIRIIPTPVQPMDSCFCTAGPGKIFIMSFMKQACLLTNLLNSPEETKPMPFLHPEKIKFGASSIPTGSQNFVAVCDNNQYHITVYDIREKKFRPKFRGFPKIPLEDEPGEFDEHEVEGLAIHPDETCLAYTTMFTSQIIIADFDGNQLRTIPGDEDRSYRSLSFTLDGKSIYLFDDKLLYFFDTTTLEETGILDNKRGMTCVQTQDAVHVLTVGEDGNLRIWDRSRSEKTDTLGTMNTQSRGTTLYSFKDQMVLKNSRYVLLCGTTTKNGKILRLEIIDVFKNKVVRHVDLPDVGGYRVLLHPTNDPNQVLLVVNRTQIFRIDISTMTFVKKYPGFMTQMAIAQDTKEMLCTTRGGMHVKVYDGNGDVAAIIKAGQKQQVFSVFINSSGTIGCATTDEGPLLLYDIKERKYMYSIEPGKYGMCFATNVVINKAGTKLFFSTDGKCPGDPEMNDIDHLVMWNIQDKKEIKRMYEPGIQKKYKALKDCDLDLGLEEVMELSDSTIITSHYDNISRIWDAENGMLLHKLPGHTCSVQISVSLTGPYIFTYGSLEEEDCFRLWDKETFTCSASFTLDQSVNTVKWSEDGKFVITFTSMNPVSVVRWHIHHGKVDVNESDYPETYTEKDFEPILIKVLERKNLKEENDPDTDPEEMSDDDEDDDEGGYG